MEKMMSVKRATAVVLVVTGLVMAIWLGMKIQASAKAGMECRELKQYCMEQEKILVKEVREYLQHRGFRDSGVTLTGVYHQDGSVDYRLTVHHGKIDNMTEEEREELLKELSGFTFPLDNCSFVPVFLINK